jgi:hypothetical protein
MMRTLMRPVAFLLLLAASLSVHAQMYRCVDANGKRSFSDKPGPGCVADAKPAAPKAAPDGGATARPPAQASPKDRVTPATKGAVKPAAATKQPAETADQRSGRCEAMKQQRAWLNSPRGESTPGREAQLAQIDKALRDCN